jgi:hypothetical protein
MNGFRRARLAALCGTALATSALAVLTIAGPVAACQGPGNPLKAIVRQADRIIIGRVVSKTGDGVNIPWRYRIQVEKVVKGGPLPDVWETGKLRDNECSQYWLDVGDHLVLEYYNPTPALDSAHFFEWTIADDGSVVPGGHHRRPYGGSYPRTLDELIAFYDAYLPDTGTATGATHPQPGTEQPTLIALGAAGAAGAGAWWLSMQRRRPRSAN